MDTEEEYKVIEKSMKKAEAELGAILSSLVSPTSLKSVLQDHLGTTAQDTTNNMEHNAPTNDDQDPLQQFLSIFAQHDLVSTLTSTYKSTTSLHPEGHRTLPRLRPPKPAERPTTLTPPAEKSKETANPFRQHNYRYYVRGDYVAYLPASKNRTNNDKTMPTNGQPLLKGDSDLNGNPSYLTYPGPQAKSPRKKPSGNFFQKVCEFNEKVVDDNFNVSEFNSLTLPRTQKDKNGDVGSPGELLSSVLSQSREKYTRSREEFRVPGEGELDELLKSMELGSCETPVQVDTGSSSANSDSFSAKSSSDVFGVTSASTDSFSGHSTLSSSSSSSSGVSCSASSSRTSTLSGTSSLGSRKSSSSSSSSGRGASPPSNEESSPPVSHKNSSGVSQNHDDVPVIVLSAASENTTDIDNILASSNAEIRNKQSITSKQQTSQCCEGSSAKLNKIRLGTGKKDELHSSVGGSSSSAADTAGPHRMDKMDTEVRVAVIDTVPMEYISGEYIDLEEVTELQGQGQSPVMPEKHETWLKERRAKNKKIETIAANRRNASPAKSVQRNDGKISEGTQTRTGARAYKGSKSETFVETRQDTSSQSSPLQKPYSKYRSNSFSERTAESSGCNSSQNAAFKVQNNKILSRPALPSLVIPSPPPSDTGSTSSSQSGQQVVLKTATITTLTTEYIDQAGDMCVELGDEFYQNTAEEESRELKTGHLLVNSSNVARKRPVIPPKLVAPPLPPRLPPSPPPTDCMDPECSECGSSASSSAYMVSPLSPGVPRRPIELLLPPPPPLPPAPDVPMSPRSPGREVPLMGALVIPSREQRRVQAKPLMPSITEDCSAGESTDEDDIEEEDEDITSSAASSLRKTHKRTPSSSSSVISYDGVKKLRNDSDDGNKPLSLLDSMHKKYCAKQYHYSRARSAEALCRRAESDETLGTKTMPNTKTKGLLSVEAEPIRRLSDSRLEADRPRRSSSESRASRSRKREHSPCYKNTIAYGIIEQPEIEALEACKWLRAAGFPQYAQMYEEHQFPIDIAAVEKDHDFLDQDSIQSLFRRLTTLNKCATMKIDAPHRKSTDDSDEEEQCALSDKWKYQRSSRRWSRKDLDHSMLASVQNGYHGRQGIRSSSSHDSVITDLDDSISPNEESPVFRSRSSQHGSFSIQLVPHTGHVSDSDNSQASSTGPMSPSLRRSASERFKGASKSFLSRMQSLKNKKAKSRQPPQLKFPPGKTLEISGPTVVGTEEMKLRMDRLGCVDISPTSEQAQKAITAQLEHLSLDSSHPNTNANTNPSVTKTSSSSHGCIDVPRRASSVGRNEENRLSMYDNVVPPRVGSTKERGGGERNHHDEEEDDEEGDDDDDEHDHQAKLDLILRDLYENISGLNKTLGEEEEQQDFCSYALKDFNPDNKLKAKSSQNNPSKRTVADSMDKKQLNNRNDVLESDNIDMVDIKFIEQLSVDTSSKSSCKHSPPSSTSSLSTASPNVTSDSVLSPPPEITMSPSSSSLSPANAPPPPDSPLEHEDRSSSMSSNQEELSDHEEEDGSEDRSAPGGSVGTKGDSGNNAAALRERRDSGVGSSLTRAPSDRRRHRIRWHSFMKSHRPSLNSRNLQISGMSAGQMMVLRRLCLLKVTSLMEKYSPSSRSGWNWVMPKFMKRFKSPDYSDKNVFGVPLTVVLQRTGQPLPQCVLYAMRCLRRNAHDAVGIFRKSGVRSRIQKLRNEVETNPESVDFETLQPYDVADLIKQYFRELPECLLTNKLSESFINIFTYVPSEQRLEALQATVMLLPDENCEVLQSLLLFLSDMAQHADLNQMTASNLAVCFAPSLFNMCGPKNNPTASPKRGRKSLGVPDAKELHDQKAAHECLTTMIVDCKKLFMVPEELLSKFRFSYMEQGDPVNLEDLGRKLGPDGEEVAPGDFKAHMELCVHGLLKESRDRFKGWVSVAGAPVELAYRKVGDGHPLRLWKTSVEVEAPPVEVLNRLLNERHLWDEDLLKWRSVEKLDANTEVFQYVLNTMAPHPTRDVTELRAWRTELPPKGACVLVATSVAHRNAPLLGGVCAVVLASRYLIEPCGAGKSRLTHIARVDIRGHSVEWYNKVYGHLCANLMTKIRDSFEQTLGCTDGPETKI